MYTSWNVIKYIYLAGILACGLSVVLTTPSHAEAWQSSKPDVTYVKIDHDQTYCERGDYEQIYLDRTGGGIMTGACVVHGSTLDIAELPMVFGNGMTRAILLHGTDGYALLAAGINGQLVPRTDQFIYPEYKAVLGSPVLLMSTNLRDDLEPSMGNVAGLPATIYNIDEAKAIDLLGTSSQSQGRYGVISYRFSSNGRYVVANVESRLDTTTQYVRIDTKTLGVTMLAAESVFNLGYHGDGPTVKAVADDGQFALIGPQLRVIRATNCGRTFGGSFAFPDVLLNNCPLTDMTSQVESRLGHPFITESERFNADGSIAFVATDPATWPQPPYTVDTSVFEAVTLYDNEDDVVVPAPQLDYLALGDSYSSGEGALGGYLAGTGGEKLCHLSGTSYPYLIAKHYSIDSMQSVACSGAKVMQDYLGDPESYPGQHGELRQLSSNDADRKRQDALANFTPGIVPQIEFVKRYHPKIVTLTGGGNDVGFSDILTYCAGVHLDALLGSTSALTGNDACGYATKGSQLEQLLDSSIDTQYSSLLRFIQEIQ